MLTTRRSSALTLSDRLPELAAEWHPTLNGNLRLDELTTNSTVPVWWQCQRVPAHIWRASVKSRYSKHTGCRRCRLALRHREGSDFRERTLAVRAPDIAATWHPTKNGTLTPHDVSINSRYRAWWQCDVNPDHVFDTTVNNRHRGGCPYCAGHRVRKTGPRQRQTGRVIETHPTLLAEWHPIYNGHRDPTTLAASSGFVVWWQCPHNPEHVYQASIRSRTRLTKPVNCPHCREIKRQLIKLYHASKETPLPRRNQT